MHARKLLGWIAISMCSFLPAVSAAEEDAPVVKAEYLVILDGPAWPHGKYTELIEGKMFGPPAMTMIETVGHQGMVRYQPKKGACFMLQTLLEGAAPNAMSLTVDLLECPADANVMGKTPLPGTSRTRISLLLNQSTSVRYDDENQVRFVTQRFIRPGER